MRRVQGTVELQERAPALDNALMLPGGRNRKNPVLWRELRVDRQPSRERSLRPIADLALNDFRGLALFRVESDPRKAIAL